MEIFVSVGTGLSPQQEAFVSAIEARLRAVGLVPCTIGRNTFSADAPLRSVAELMDRCVGTVVIALERFHFDNGTERRGSQRERAIGSTTLPTSWNQIEAAMAYSRGLPLLVIVEASLHCDGLLEKGNDWFVQELPLELSSLSSPVFNGILESWRERISLHQQKSKEEQSTAAKDPATMTLAQLFGALKLSQIWAALVGFVAALGGAFALGARLTGKLG